jgi:TPR repeat protein
MSTSAIEIDDALVELTNALNNDDKEEVAKQLKVLQGLGKPQTYASIAATYEFGSETVQQRDDLAFEWYVKSAFEEGSGESYLSIARFYYYGKHVEKDLHQYLKYCELAFEHGCHAAGINLAGHYIFGDGVAVDLDRAESYLRPALADGYIAAQSMIAKIEFLRGHYFKGAKTWLNCAISAIRLGFRDPQDQKFYSLKNEQALRVDVSNAKMESERWRRENFPNG